MQVGSLVKLKQPCNVEYILILVLHGAMIPPDNEVFTVTEMNPWKCGNCDKDHNNLVLAEHKTYLNEHGVDTGLPEDIYVEVQPPQENVQEMFDKIVEENPILHLVEAE